MGGTFFKKWVFGPIGYGAARQQCAALGGTLTIHARLPILNAYLVECYWIG